MTIENSVSQIQSTTKTWFDIALALLDWPFLLFGILVIFVWRYKSEVASLMSRGDIQIGWGENKFIKLKDISDGFDQEIDPLRDEIQILRDELASITNKNSDYDPSDLSNKKTEMTDEQKQAATKKMIDGLENHQYRWRSINRLATNVGIAENDALDLLRLHPEVVLGVGKTGRQIARKKER